MNKKSSSSSTLPSSIDSDAESPFLPAGSAPLLPGQLILPDQPDTLIPFEREIYLFDTFVAGISHLKNPEKALQDLKADEILYFFREPENPFDSGAIRVERTGAVKVGYIPRSDNIVFARLMDAGKYLYGKVRGVEKHGKWSRISLGIFLKD